MEAMEGFKRLRRSLFNGAKILMTTKAMTMVAKKRRQQPADHNQRYGKNHQKKEKHSLFRMRIFHNLTIIVVRRSPWLPGFHELFAQAPQGCKEKKHFVNNDLGKASKKMIYDSASDNRRHCRVKTMIPIFLLMSIIKCPSISLYIQFDAP